MVTLSEAPTAGDRRGRARRATWALALLTLLAAWGSLATGASGISLLDALGRLISGEGLSLQEQVVLWQIRLPRLATGLLVGASLAVSGAVMQGLFRNPLADPGLVGVGAGAGLGAVLAIVLGGLLPAALAGWFGMHLVPIAAFLGGWAATLILYRVSTRAGRTSVATMLLAGIALGALAGAATGVLVYAADDQQLRDLTFWNLGSLAGASWAKLSIAAPIMAIAMLGTLGLARGLNGLALGEAAAAHMGIPVQRMKNLAILCVAAATGAAVAVSGGIGFIGIVVPHLLRLSTGPDHRHLLPNAALLGAALLVGADMIARSILAPAELPIGIVTALMGAPVFLWILLRRRGLLDL
ncbi:FecCD family ABC transporter permease [Pseudodonghicola xiamenensis]|uniref:Heme ABC transporter permease n=1 Tax=Pseudodonghicola xiamenensis TaxID=337702 RepID=A0A8J3HD45_9RHOB|nr:iron ABC transporter permease [Pseudodonghicola xiamenensis]GHH04342.1 heme ABC transporter permease [Pseudodonghicola xiamenensis]